MKYIYKKHIVITRISFTIVAIGLLIENISTYHSLFIDNKIVTAINVIILFFILINMSYTSKKIENQGQFTMMDKKFKKLLKDESLIIFAIEKFLLVGCLISISSRILNLDKVMQIDFIVIILFSFYILSLPFYIKKVQKIIDENELDNFE